jgi:pyridoxal phosphate enzyme (YggS family)
MWDRRLAETLPRVEERIGRALDRAGREGGVRVVAVTKGHPSEAAAAAVRAGVRILGENRVQELERKVAEVGRDGVEWHMIGHLQRNKARSAVPLFDTIHSVDSLRLGRRLAKEGERVGRPVRGLLQVNVSGEGSKGGFTPETAVDAVAELEELDSIRLQGLMTMAPLTDDEAVLRRTFADTRGLLEECRRQLPGCLGAGELSMGMSNDFEIAIEEGATLVRLGTVLFGEREQT